MHHRQLHRPGLQHLRAERGHFQHLLIGDFRKTPRFWHDPRVGGVDTVDICIDIAAVCAQGGGNRDSAGVGAAASQRCDAPIGADALKSGDNGHFSAS